MTLIRCPKKYCPLIYAPVCAIQFPCSQTYSNSCFACLNSSTIGYINGPCPHTTPNLEALDTYTCAISDTYRKLPCDPVKGYNYVCAYLNIKCSYGQCTTYYSNKCDACGNSSVQKVTPGLCPLDQKWFSDVKSYLCKDSDRSANTECPDNDIGICAVTTNGLAAYPNVCIACKDPNVIEVFNKACPALN